MPMRASLALVAVMVAAGVVLGGCNTIQGFGKDLSKVGDTIEGAAKKSK